MTTGRKSWIGYLCELPQSAGDWNQRRNQVPHFLFEATLLAVVSSADDAENLVNGGVRWQRAVVDDKVTFQTLGNVVSASSWVDHGGQELKKYNQTSSSSNLYYFVMQTQLFDHVNGK